MATADATEQARPRAAFPWEARLLLTLALLALYHFGHRLPLPLVQGRFEELPGLASRINLLTFGFTPLFTGFLLVELFSVATTPGRRLRQAGVAGRARLNRAALGTSLVVAAIQALWFAKVLETMTTPGGMSFVADPGTGFVLITMATVTAMTAAVFVLANLLSDYGIGNGFALLNLVDLGAQIAGLRGQELNPEQSGSPVPGFWLLGLAVLTFLLIRHLRGTEATHTPGFPQGILPVMLTGAVLSFVVRRLWGSFREDPWMLYAALGLAAVALFSWIGFHLFSSRARLEANLPETPEVLEGLAVLLRRRLPLATALLAAGTVGFLAWQRDVLVSDLAATGFVDLVLVVTIGFDLVEQYRFIKRNGPTVRLVQLDNVHFSYRLAERLKEEGIDALARGHVLRSLYFLFGPLYKIDVLVPAEDLDEAGRVLAELEVAREVKVF
jgi:SecY/Putative prokaryotic signal transducing protein